MPSVNLKNFGTDHSIKTVVYIDGIIYILTGIVVQFIAIVCLWFISGEFAVIKVKC